jgi:hypothetical protein
MNMKVYVQFYHLSTGYEGTQFSESNKKPIELCGSDGVFILDGRNSLETMKDDANDRMQKLNKFGEQITGYKIVRANSFLDNGKVVYSSF